MSDHSDDYDMQINGQVDGLVGVDETPPVDSKGAKQMTFEEFIAELERIISEERFSQSSKRFQECVTRVLYLARKANK